MYAVMRLLMQEQQMVPAFIWQCTTLYHDSTALYHDSTALYHGSTTLYLMMLLLKRVRNKSTEKKICDPAGIGTQDLLNTIVRRSYH